MSNDTQESQLGSTRPRLTHPSILTQMQIERLKREDEEEHWISGEELYTEGSSDDDDDHRDAVLIRDAESVKSNYSGNPAIVCRSKSTTLVSGHHRSQIRHRQKVKLEQTDSAAIETRKEEEKEEQDAASSSDVATPDGAVGATGDHEEPEEHREISWRPKRADNKYETIVSQLENSTEIIELRELQLEYSDIVDSISGLKTSLTPLIVSSRNNNCGNEIEIAVDGGDMIIEDDDHGSIFFDEYLDRWTEAVVHHCDIEKERTKVAKFDSCIEKIYDRVKKAREETLKEQISNREELKKMQSLRAPESGVVAKNSDLFFKLCETMESQLECINDDELGLKIASRVERRKEEEDQEQELEDNESRKSRREKLEEKLVQIENRRANFIERNKELASCAMGTLAITDEEKKRLNELLEDIDVEECRSTPALTDRETATSFSTPVSSLSTPYTIDKEADELLKELTERLSIMNSETYRKSAREEREEEGKNLREEFLPHKEQIVLNSLRNLAESGSEEIYPISEEEVRQLIREYHAEQEAIEFSKDLNADSNLSPTMSENPTIAQKVIRGLIKEAKATMPLFKFKYQTEELQDEDENEMKSA